MNQHKSIHRAFDIISDQETCATAKRIVERLREFIRLAGLKDDVGSVEVETNTKIVWVREEE
jgi:hypothetical protein